MSQQAPELPNLKGLDRPEITAYLEKVRKYDQLAKCWHESRGLPCQPISHKVRVDPVLLDALKWTGVNIDPDEEIQKWLQATAEVHENAFRELDKEQLLTHRLEWKWGASNVKGAFLALVTETAGILRDAGVYDTICQGGEWDLTKTHGITTGVTRSIGHRQVQSLALTAIANDEDLRVNPSSFFAYMIRRVTERFPDAHPGRPQGSSSRDGWTEKCSGGVGSFNKTLTNNINKEYKRQYKSQPSETRTCFKCGKPGYVAKICRSTDKPPLSDEKNTLERIELKRDWGERLRPREVVNQARTQPQAV